MKRAVIYLRVSTSAQADRDNEKEGYSIPAQRDACVRKAENLEAAVVDEYVDRGESARSADRPALQEMLQRIENLNDIDYVIVHKVDRLARSRRDDVEIGLLIKKAGATLVSATENIDETPSGKLLHGIMATIAEFYSANLASEARKGMRQKAIAGGTPYRAPLGYLNVRKRIDGREIRTVEIDPERAPHVQWAFDAYATGEWTIRGMCAELDERGFRGHPTRKSPGKPFNPSNVADMLHNRYYIGIVTWDGIDYEGRHEPIIDLDTFDRVQQLLTERNISGEKTSKHWHYLKGSIFCATCGSRLTVANAKGNGGTYQYAFCLGRQRRNGCTQPYLPTDQVEDAVVDYYQVITLDPSRLDEIRQHVTDHIEITRNLNTKEIDRQQRRLTKLRDERKKLLNAHYADAITVDLLREEQARITTEEAQAQRILDSCTLRFDEIERNLDQALNLAADCLEAYARATDEIRRTFNQVFFEKIWVGEDGVEGVDLKLPFAHLLAHDLTERLEHETAALTDPTLATYRRKLPIDRTQRPRGALPWENKNRDLLFVGHGSNVSCLVGPAGLEPSLTPHPPRRRPTPSPLFRVNPGKKNSIPSPNAASPPKRRARQWS
ncbi:MAG: recombinase family protein [Acidimicrobiia bacterium]|nr:MAG: recombinase family protein [Acidimicrobiia bacterium]